MPFAIRRRHVRNVSILVALIVVGFASVLVVGDYFTDGPGSPGAHNPVTASTCDLSGWIAGIREDIGRPSRTNTPTRQDFLCNGRGPKTVAEDWQADPCGVLRLDQASTVAGYAVVAGQPSPATCTYSSADRASRFVLRIDPDGGAPAYAAAVAALAKDGAPKAIGGLGERANGLDGVVVAQAGTTVLRVADTVHGTPASQAQAARIAQAVLAKRCVPVGDLLTPDCP